MQFFKYFFLLILWSSAILACDEVGTVRHTNPDSSIGGLIGPLTKVNANAYVGYNAKICGKAWVDAGAKVLDQAVVKGNAWIREYSTVKDYAAVSDDAVLWGTRNAPVIVSGRSKIYERAKILTGTEVADDSQVYGDVSIKDSKLSEQARVCDKYSIKEQVLIDSYFCNLGESYSNDEVTLKSYNVKWINKKKSNIRLSLNKYNFHQDKKLFLIYLNGILLEPSMINIHRNQLVITDTNNYQKEGLNTVMIKGRDEYNKNLYTEGAIEFYIGTGVKEIQIVNANNIQEDMKVDISFQMNGEEYKGTGKISNNVIFVDSIPEDSHSYGLKIRAVGATTMIFENFLNVQDVPAAIESYTLPNYVNNNPDFSDNLISWKISHPANVSVVNENSKNNLQIVGSASERVEISKKFRLNRTNSGLQFDYILPSSSSFLINNSTMVDVLIISMKDKSIISQSDESVSEPNSKSKASVFNKESEGDYVIMIRIEPHVTSKNQNELFKMFDILVADVAVKFAPYTFNVLNRIKFNLPDTNDNSKCKDPSFNFANKKSPFFKKSMQEGLPFFSAGSIYDMAEVVSQNRIYGTIDIAGAYGAQVESIKLQIIQNGIVVVEQPLASCAKKNFEESNTLTSFLSKNESLVGHLFAIPLPTVGINTYPGSTVDLVVKLTLKRAGPNVVLSNPIRLKTLVVPAIGKSRYYGKVDYYDMSEGSYLRTGGDKWILPGYASILESMMSRLPGWNINDLAKLNGGEFPGHFGHSTGHEGDFRFDETSSVYFNFSKMIAENVSNEKWQVVFSKIENFINQNEQWFDIIEKIFITMEQEESEDGRFVVPIDKKFVQSRFQYRCFGINKTRYVDLNEPRWSGGSLLRQQNGHWDHIHLTYNVPDNSTLGLPKLKEIISPKLDLDLLVFEMVNDKLSVNYKDASIVPSYIKTFWRLQKIEGFNDIDALIDLDTVPPTSFSKKEKNNMRKNNFDGDERWIHVVFADTRSGGCVDRKVKFNASLLKKKKWIFQKKANVYREII